VQATVAVATGYTVPQEEKEPEEKLINMIKWEIER
jgi:hypothetical protein